MNSLLVPYKILLPKHIFGASSDEEEIKKLVLDYMQRYPHYSFLYIENGFAVCERIHVTRGDNYG